MAIHLGTLSHNVACGPWPQHERHPQRVRIQASAVSRVEQLLRPLGRVVSPRPSEVNSSVLRYFCGRRGRQLFCPCRRLWDSARAAAPYTIRPGRRINITWCAIRWASSPHFAEAREQKRSFNSAPRARPRAKFWTAGLGNVLGDTMHKCCGAERGGGGGGQTLRPCGFALAFIASDFIGQPS